MTLLPRPTSMWLCHVGAFATGSLSSFRVAPPGWGILLSAAASGSVSTSSAAALSALLPRFLQLTGMSFLPLDELADALCSRQSLSVVQGLGHPFFEEVPPSLVALGEAHHDSGQREVL